MRKDKPFFTTFDKKEIEKFKKLVSHFQEKCKKAGITSEEIMTVIDTNLILTMLGAVDLQDKYDKLLKEHNKLIRKYNSSQHNYRIP